MSDKWSNRFKTIALLFAVFGLMVQGQCIVWLAERIKVLEDKTIVTKEQP